MALRENRARVNRRATVGLAILPCSGLNMGTTVSFFPFNPFTVLHTKPDTGYDLQTKARVWKVLSSHLNSHDERAWVFSKYLLCRS